MLWRSHILLLCILSVSGFSAEKNRCPFQIFSWARQKATRPPILESQELAYKDKGFEAVQEIERRSPNPGPEELWEGSVVLHGRSHHGEFKTPVLLAHEQASFSKNFRDRMNRYRRDRKPFTRSALVQAVQRAHLDLVREIERQYEERKVLGSEGELTDFKNRIQAHYSAILYRLTVILDGDPPMDLLPAERSPWRP